MDLGNTLQGEGLAIKLMAARAVGAYSEGKDIPNKMQELLRNLIIENMKEDATDEGMEDMLYSECESRRLDADTVMAHFSAITANIQALIFDDLIVDSESVLPWGGSSESAEHSAEMSR